MITKLPERLESEEQLEDLLSTPDEALVEDMKKLSGDIMILGAGGKIGPTQVKLAQRAVKAAGVKKKVLAVSDVFASDAVRQELEAMGVETRIADLTDTAALKALPDVENIVFLAGMKFGSTGKEALLYALNCYMPGLVADRFRKSRIVEVSSGNVMGLNSIFHGGATAGMPLDPVGDYARSVVGRERMFEHFSRVHGNPGVAFCLFYANEMRYGVLMDVGQKVRAGETIDLTMGNYNCLWQGDANSQILRSLLLADNPPRRIIGTGPEILSVRWVAQRFGELLGKEPVFTGSEAPDLILGNAAEAMRLFGYPRVSVDQMILWGAHWLQKGLPMLGKPTKFQVRSGKF